MLIRPDSRRLKVRADKLHPCRGGTSAEGFVDEVDENGERLIAKDSISRQFSVPIESALPYTEAAEQLLIAADQDTRAEAQAAMLEEMAALPVSMDAEANALAEAEITARYDAVVAATPYADCTFESEIP